MTKVLSRYQPAFLGWLAAGMLAALVQAGDRDAAGAKDSNLWWSLRPLSQSLPPELGKVPEGWDHPIDRFIFQKLAEHNLVPSPPAERRALIRRATYDLLGLPPSPEEVEAFVDDPRPDAYPRLIDRLLASPHYGERWGRHWMDVIRFGESRGFERNEIINTLWPFRDYLIRSLNDDKPFNQLILEHLAGDVLGPGDPQMEIATAFLVAGPYDDVGNQDPVQAQTIRANTVDEIITATSTAFLGLTVNCARCHDHKFDPISAEDYYRFYAVFTGVHHGERTLATEEERRRREEQLKPLEARRAGAQRALADFDQSILERKSGPEAPQASTSAGTARLHGESLPKVDPHLTEDRFGPVEAQWVRLSILSNNRDPRGAGSVRIDEFEIWSAEETPRNVALAASGAKAAGPSRRAEDFAGAYAPALVNDGQYGARWIVDGRAQLTIELPRTERINRITFSADRYKSLPAESGEIVFVGEYQIEVSLDGTAWKVVADSLDRPPLNDAFARERTLQAAMTGADRAERARLEQALAQANTALRAVPPLRTAWAGRFEQPKEPVHLLKGGDVTKKGEEVRPGSLSALENVAPSFTLPSDTPENQRRLELARWLIHPGNPLTARVLANRIWHYHFGAGIVDTPSDFGKLGGLPTHPVLLDWLARRLQEHGWRLKPLHREIMLSQTYRQSAAWRDEAGQQDADSRWLWRFPPRRLSAEEIRDTMLSVAGALDQRMGGPGFKLYRYLQDNVATYVPLEEHGPATYRRAVYHHNARAAHIDLMTEFDLPDCAFPEPNRAVTTSPLQALTWLNHSFTVDLSERMAGRIEREAGPEPGDQVRRAFALLYGRAPRPGEMKASADLVRAHRLPALCRALLNSNEMIYLE